MRRKVSLPTSRSASPTSPDDSPEGIRSAGNRRAHARAFPAVTTARALAVWLACVMGLGVPAAARGQEPGAPPREATAPRLGGLRTGTLLFPAQGVMFVSLGAEYLPEVTNDLAGVRGELVRLPTMDLKLGLADQAMFQVTWPILNRLRVHEQQDPPPLGRKLGEVSTDWGDVTVATLIRLSDQRGPLPSCGIRFAAELPTSNELLGIGDNTTDVFASTLLSRSFPANVSLNAEVGVGILTERTRTFAQNDVLTYGVLADWRARARLTVVGEVAGWYSTRGNLPGTSSRSELRLGLGMLHHGIHWTALAVHEVAGLDTRGLGVAVVGSTQFTVFRSAGAAH